MLLPAPLAPIKPRISPRSTARSNVVDGLEPAKALAESADGENAHEARSRLRKPKIPAGMRRITATRITPTTTSQVSSRVPESRAVR